MRPLRRLPRLLFHHLFLCVPLALPACGAAPAPAAPCDGETFAGSPAGIRCGRLADRDGRQLLLHGVNARIAGVFDDVYRGQHVYGPIPPFTADDAAQMRAMGLNALRLPFQWSGVEPTENGGFDEAYIDRIAKVVDACRAAGLLVLLDSHQDLWSPATGDDGAPPWASLPAPPPRDPDAAVRLGAAQACFNTFLGDSPDGTRLRGRYGKMLAHVAARFAHDDAVLGVEIMNEPLAAYAPLERFHREMVAVLRPVLPDKLLFFEPPGIRNQIDSALPGAGSLGPGTVYAPHVYTGVFHPVKGALTKEALRPSNESARDEALGWQAPLVITEWGFGWDSPDYARFVEWQQELQDEYGAGNFYWVWKESDQGRWGFFDVDPMTFAAAPRPATIAAFARVRPEAIAGTVLSNTWDPARKALEVRFRGAPDRGAANRVTPGATAGFDRWRATCDDKPVADSNRGDLSALPCGGDGEHVLRVAAE